MHATSTTYDAAVPELPDLDILADASHAALVGRPVTATRVAQSIVMRGTAGEIAALEGQVLQSVRRRGKFLVLELERDRIVLNLMLTGRLGFAAPEAKAWPQGAVASRSGTRRPAATRRSLDPSRAGATVGRKVTDVRSAMPRAWARCTCAAGVTRPVAGWDELGRCR